MNIDDLGPSPQLIWNLLLRGDAGVGVGAVGGLEEDWERSGARGTGA